MWQHIKRFFKNSETIFLARLQVLLGTVLEIVATVDPSLFAPVVGEWFPVFLIIHGVMMEILRRRRAEDLKNQD